MLRHELTKLSEKNRLLDFIIESEPKQLLQPPLVALHCKGGAVVTHLHGGITITVVLAFIIVAILTSVLFKGCLHTAIQSMILSFLLL